MGGGGGRDLSIKYRVVFSIVFFGLSRLFFVCSFVGSFGSIGRDFVRVDRSSTVVSPRAYSSLKKLLHGAFARILYTFSESKI